MIRFLITGLAASSLYSQVNTEGMRRYNAEYGFHNTIGFNLGYQSGNSDIFNIRSNYRLDWLTTNYYSFLNASYERGKSNGQLNANKGFIHLRTSRSISDMWILEAFVQREFNDFLRLKDRQLGGGGLRLEVLRSDSSRKNIRWVIALGSGAMMEYEQLNKPESSQRHIRSTNYLTIRFQPDPGFFISAITYFQIVAGHAPDYRILHDSALSLLITKYLSFVTALNVRFDHEPPAAVKNTDMTISNGISITF